jgi:murein DD-endopeptidase MepM/ murein hydrolase activator NlpD
MMRSFVHLFPALLLATPAVQAQTATPALSLPVACTIGDSCLVQKLYDLQPGPGRRDYRCGTLTTEDHDGIDIRVRTLADMRKGVAVLAAADGIVLRVRDGMADSNVRLTGKEALDGKQAGNGVVIAHGNGWETQYSHLRQASVRVTPGQKITTGTPLGLIGMSGNAEFPHLHFSVRRNGTAIDPFLNKSAGAACVAATENISGTLWTQAAAAALAYAPTAIISAGFAADKPEPLAMRLRLDEITQLPATSAALVFWVDVSGVQAGDTEIFTITAPDGTIVMRTEKQIEKPALSWFSFAGKKRTGQSWPAGIYAARYDLRRAGKNIGVLRRNIRINN